LPTDSLRDCIALLPDVLSRDTFDVVQEPSAAA
jgi:hypothetical protein